jgi:3-hydroxyacyl-[acyl-carrier-protein] dehydratase
MKYSLIDKIIGLEEGKNIIAVKNVSLAEEYLGDHFPLFPVLPGVFLLQGMVETASWLVRSSQNFSNSMVLLERARNVNYKSFAAPGMCVEYTAEAKNIDDKSSSFTVSGRCGEEEIVKAKIDLRHFNLGDENPAYTQTDAEMIEKLRLRLRLLTQNSGF